MSKMTRTQAPANRQWRVTNICTYRLRHECWSRLHVATMFAVVTDPNNDLGDVLT